MSVILSTPDFPLGFLFQNHSGLFIEILYWLSLNSLNVVSFLCLNIFKQPPCSLFLLSCKSEDADMVPTD